MVNHTRAELIAEIKRLREILKEIKARADDAEYDTNLIIPEGLATQDQIVLAAISMLAQGALLLSGETINVRRNRA